jgi:hypothetical protein
MEIEGKARGVSPVLADEDLGNVILKEVLPQILFGGNHPIQKMLVFRKTPDKFQNKGNVLFFSVPQDGVFVYCIAAHDALIMIKISDNVKP